MCRTKEALCALSSPFPFPEQIALPQLQQQQAIAATRAASINPYDLPDMQFDFGSSHYAAIASEPLPISIRGTVKALPGTQTASPYIHSSRSRSPLASSFRPAEADQDCHARLQLPANPIPAGWGNTAAQRLWHAAGNGAGLQWGSSSKPPFDATPAKVYQLPGYASLPMGGPQMTQQLAQQIAGE